MRRPAPSDYAPFYAGYIESVNEPNLLEALETQSSEMQRLISSIDENKASYRYAEGKWSVKQVIAHITDSERIFGYRILCIARGDEQPLPGFDEDTYVANADFDKWKLGDLAEAFALTRRGNVVLLRNLSEDAWERRGIANGAPITVRALAFALTGHERHHLKVLRERYQL